MKHINADDYATWVNVGIVLKPYGAVGYQLWTDWAATSLKFDATEQLRKWEHDLYAPHSSTYLSIFYTALSNGWNGWNGWNGKIPADTQQAAANDGPVAPEFVTDHPFSLKNGLASGAGHVTVFEYLYDDFMSVGVNVVAGAPGVGKTTLIVPLALAAAHLCPPDHPLKPAVRRNVIIITESVIQVQHVIYSLYSWGYTGKSVADFDERVCVINAHRLDPLVVAGVAEEYKEWTVDNLKADGSYYAALPLVVFDTANAVFDLENENDNAEVGRAVAFIKQSFAGFPVIIVSHTAKTLASMASEGASPRGASAWMGDAHGVYSVFKDGEAHNAPRVLKATKVRFPTAFTEISFDLISHCESQKDVLGHDKDIWFSHATAHPLKPGERIKIKEEQKEQKEQEDWASLCDDLVELVRKESGKTRTYYERLAPADGGVAGRRERKARAIGCLLQDGSLESATDDSILRVNEDVVAKIKQGVL